MNYLPRVIHLFACGSTSYEISKALDISESHVVRIFNRAREDKRLALREAHL